MSDATPKNIIRIALLSTWGMITLVLVFVVSILLYKMYQQGQDPMGYAEEITPSSQAVPSSPSVVTLTKTIDVDIFFGAPNGASLIPQQHRLEITNSTVENCRIALKALIAGPNSAEVSPILSAKTTVRGMYLLDNNELVIDFSRDLEAGHINSATADMLLVDGITRTLTQPSLQAENDRIVRSIRFLFEGAAYQGTFPAHYDLSNAVRHSAQSAAGDTLDAL